MLLVATIALAIWFGGKMVSLHRTLRAVLLGLLAAFVLLSFLILPTDSMILKVLGGSFSLWMTVILLLSIVFSYGFVLSLIKKKTTKLTNQTQGDGPFSDAELDRYARHIVLREIGGTGQVALKNAKVLVIGAGGLGSPVLLYLSAAGVGTIGVVDDDVVDNSNLQRQVIHSDADIGTLKVNSAKETMCRQNPFVTVNAYAVRLTKENAYEIMRDYDIVVEGSDNFETRYLVNKVAASFSIPVVSGALTQWEGQLSVFDPNAGFPCYQCVFPAAPKSDLAPNCSQAGVVGPLTGVLGSMMAVEVVKEITGAGRGLRGKMLIYDAAYAETRVIKISKRADCPCCSGQ